MGPHDETIGPARATGRGEDERLRFLVAAGQLLAESLDLDTTLERLAHLCVPRLGDWCVIDLFDADGALVSAATAHVDPDRVALARELRARVPLAPDSPIGAAKVARTGEPELIEHIDQTVLDSAIAEPEIRAIIAQLALHSSLVVPIAARGRVLGTISLVAAETHAPYGPDDLRVALALGGRAGLAIDNARLHQAAEAARAEAERARAEAERAATWIARLQSVTAGLAAAPTPRAVSAAVLRQSAKAVGATAGFMGLLSPAGDELVLVETYGEHRPLPEELRRFPVSAPLPASEVVRTGEPLYFSNRAALFERYPGVEPDMREGPTEAVAVVPLWADRAIGYVYWTFPTERDFPADDRSLLQAVAAECADALVRSRLYASELEARTRTERQQELSSRLGERLTLRDVTVAILEHGVLGVGASAGAVLLLDEASQTLKLEDWLGFDDDDKANHTAVPLGASVPSAFTARTGTPLYLRSREELLEKHPEVDAARIERRGNHAWATLPLIAYERTLGVLALSFRRPREFETEDRGFLEAVAAQCAHALDRARLHDEVVAARERLDAVLRQMPSGVVIAESPSGRILLGNEQVERIWRKPFVGSDDLEAWLAAYQGFDGDGRALQNEDWPLARALATGEEVNGEEIDIARGDGTSGTIRVNAAPIRDASDAIVAGVSMFDDVTDEVAGRRRAERLAANLHRLAEASVAITASATKLDDVLRVTAEEAAAVVGAGGSTVSLGDAPRSPAAAEHLLMPLVGRGGERLGTLDLAPAAGGRPFDADDAAIVAQLAQMAALAIEMARRYETEHTTAEVLQRSLLPDALPQSEGISLAARYLPAAGHDRIGGDWYDAMALPDGSILLVIGDVVGRGIPAASTMGQLRNALRGLVLTGLSPGEALTGLDRMTLALDGDDMATVLCLVLDPLERIVVYANAGHPPALAVRPDGAIRFLSEAVGPPIGAIGGAVYGERAEHLAPGTLLALYTDGLVERRGETIDAGLSRLADAIVAAEGEVDEVADRVLEQLGTDPRHSDDTALLMAQLARLPQEALRVTLPARPESLAPARAQLRGWLAGLGAGEDVVVDLLIATGEAAANAIEHAYGSEDGVLELTAELRASEIVITVSDTGRWHGPRSDGRGRGLAIMRALTTGADIATAADGTVVTLRRALGAGVRA